MIKTLLSVKQNELMEDLIVKYGQFVTFAQIQEEARDMWDYKQMKNTLTKMVENGWLIRIKRGLYALSDLSTRGALALPPSLVANLLVSDSYVSFESALQYYGLFDQLTDKTVSISLKRFKTISLYQTEYSFIQTKPQFYYGWKSVDVSNHPVRIASIEKALIDMIHFHKSHYTIDIVIETLQNHRKDIDLRRLNEYISLSSSVTIKVFGVIFDLIGIKSDALHRVSRVTHSTHWMLPGDIKFNAKWRIYYNPFFDKYQAI